MFEKRFPTRSKIAPNSSSFMRERCCAHAAFSTEMTSVLPRISFGKVRS